MKKLHDFYKKHFVVFLIIFSVLGVALLWTAVFAFLFFLGGIEAVNSGLRSLAITFGIAVGAFLLLIYATTENMFLRLVSTLGIVVVAIFLIVCAINNI